MSSTDLMLLEVLQRIKVLEVRLDEHEKIHLENQPINNEEKKIKVIDKNQEKSARNCIIVENRNSARKYLIEKLQELHPEYAIRIASREEGSGLHVSYDKDGENQEFIIKVSFSRSYEDKFSWHAINRDDIFDSNYKYFAFMVRYAEGPCVLICNKEEIKELVGNIKETTAQMIHFGIEKNGNRYFEIRNGNKDVTYMLDRFDILV